MCDITSSIPFECNNSLGGVQKLILIPFIEDAVTITGSEATALNGSITEAFDYVITGNVHSFTETRTPNNDNGTSPVVQTLVAMLKRTNATKTAELNLLAQGRVIVFAKDNNDNYHALGLWRGMNCEVVKTSGAATADMNGYTINGTADAKELSPILDSATATALEALI